MSRTSVFCAVGHEVKEHLLFSAFEVGLVEEVTLAAYDELEVVQQGSGDPGVTRALLAQVHHALARHALGMQ
jgi:hypothetical protein